MGNCLSFQVSCDKTLNLVCGSLFGDGNYIHMMEANLEALDKTMRQLEERREDLLRRVVIEEDQGLQRLAQVQGWFLRVQGVASQANDLLEFRSTQTERLCLCGYCSKKCIPSFDYGEKVSKMLKQVEGLLAEGIFDVVAEKSPVPKVEKKHIQPTVGIDAKVQEAWSSLTNSERRILGLYGMGGVGKTTLLARIRNNFFEVENEFDVVIWVVVSKDLQYEGIQDQILRRLRLDKEQKQETEEEKASRIYNILRIKKFVLLLDDLWSEVEFDKIGVPFPTRENGSKIVFTTRSKEVCKNMEADDEIEVVCLSPDEAWELFQKKVGENPLKRHKDIPELARKVAEKCCGLPLALNVIGKAMACKDTVEEWHNAIHVLNSSSHEFPGMEEKILSILKFSYDGLKDEKVKSCFLYISLFPEDYEVRKEELIEYLTFEGFIDGNRDGDGANYQGHDIIGTLVRAHLLMEGEFTTLKVKMHDVIREMALWIGSEFGKQKEALSVRSGAQFSHVPKDISWEFVKRISLVQNDISEVSCSPDCPNLLTLLLRKNKLVAISGEFFQFMPALVVLDLSQNRSLIVLPEEISNLGCLQYLNLASTGIKSLPAGLKVLRKLIYLNLEYTRELECIVEILTSLPNLQVLKLLNSYVYVDDILMEVVQQLEHLKILTADVKDVLILESIQGLDRLASCIRGLCLRNISAEGITLNTVALGGLQRLVIKDSKILEIKIEWEGRERSEFPCTRYPSFKRLSAVEVYCVEGPKDLTWLMYAQDLKALSVGRSSSIEEIISREKELSISNLHPDISVPLEKLEFLGISHLDELQSICWNPRTLTNLRKFVQGGFLPKLSQAATEFEGPKVEAHGMGE